MLALINLVDATNVSAVGYSSDLGISFTFLPTLKIILSSTGCGSGTGGLCIEDLSPGTANDSNILTITVLNNTGNGYTLTANVGDNTTNSGRFNTSDLVHTDTNITNKFTSLATNANIANNTDFTDSTWGYSYMDETLSNPSWSNYSGLPLYSATTPATLKTSYSPATSAEGDKIKFKIAAKSASNQASGEYNNVINFMITSQPIPVTLSMAYENAGKQKYNGYYKLQDMNQSICNATEVLDEGSQMQAIDIRDNKVYWITKLQDGKCWMTQNLDHDIDSTKTYTSNDTDVPADWKPDKSTYPTSTTTWDTSSTGYNIQQSYDPGDKIWNGVTTSSSGTTINNMVQGTNQHYHLGNYYNWGAAVAMNNTSSYTADNTDVNQSICPKGWMLPKSGTTNTSAGSFQYLVNQYNWASNSMTNPNMWATPLYFPLAGDWYGSSGGVAYVGYFWSSVVSSSSYAYYLYGHYSGMVLPANGYYRYYGFSVRCVSR